MNRFTISFTNTMILFIIIILFFILIIFFIKNISTMIEFKSPILLRCINITYFNLLKEILSVIVLFSVLIKIVFCLINDLSLLSIIIPIAISFAITTFILDKFTYSEYIIIRSIQKFLFINFIMLTLGFFAYYFPFYDIVLSCVWCVPTDATVSSTSHITGGNDSKLVEVSKVTNYSGKEKYNFSLDQSLVDNTLKTVGSCLHMAVDKVLPNMVVGAAGGALGAAVFKFLASLSFTGRVAVSIGATAGCTLGAYVGIAGGSAIVKNANIAESIKNSPQSDPAPDRVPSPELGPNYINSPLEESSPLQDLLAYSLILDALILIILISILIIICNRYFFKFNLIFINNIITRYFPINIQNWFDKKINSTIEYNNKFIIVILIIYLLLLFFLIFLKLFISSTLLVDLDSYILVHNFIHNKENSILFFMIMRPLYTNRNYSTKFKPFIKNNLFFINSNRSWSDSIRSAFIFGSGALRLYLIRGAGTPLTRGFVIGTRLLGDAATKVVKNTINDPEYVLKHFSFNGHSLSELSKLLINGIIERLKFILEPVQVDYSSVVLSNQVYHLSIIIFILSIIIFGLIVVLLLNIVLYVNMDTIIKLFKNKFIKWYLIFNKKYLIIEIFLIGGTILYFMYSLIKGIHFIATHPILIN